jgi:tetratricopeptide (TPR) repeat protein
MIDKDDRTAIASRTATALIKDKRPIEALTVLRQLLPTFLADPGDHQLAFKRLADVADALKHNELKICALEQAVALNPADHDTRHLLAWLYSDMNKHKPSAFHYKVLVDNGQRPSAINNLGVVYSDLGLKASEITCYIDASPDYLLAQANLAQAYLERGFLDEAHKRAIAVITTADNEDQAASRARYVLQGIESLRDSEKEKISVLDSDTRDERLYRIEYAHATFNNPVTFTRQFETVHGTLNISVSENKIDGIGSYKRARSGLGALMLGPSQTTTEWHHELKLTGEMLGLSGTFKLTLTTTVPGNQFITPRVTEIEGLLIVSQNLAAMKLLEFGDPPRVTTALSVQ